MFVGRLCVSQIGTDIFSKPCITGHQNRSTARCVQVQVSTVRFYSVDVVHTLAVYLILTDVLQADGIAPPPPSNEKVALDRNAEKARIQALKVSLRVFSVLQESTAELTALMSRKICAFLKPDSEETQM